MRRITYTVVRKIQWLMSFGLICCLLISKPCSANDEWIGKDKFQHFVTSAVIAVGITSLVQTETNRNCLAPAVAISVTLSIGLLKEMYDKYGKKTAWSWKDMAWNLFGSTAGTLLASKCD